VRVYAGVDPVTERRHDLIEIIHRAKRRPEGSRSSRPICEPIAERRHPWTNATVDQLLDRYLDQFDGAPNTLTLYRGDTSASTSRYDVLPLEVRLDRVALIDSAPASSGRFRLRREDASAATAAAPADRGGSGSKWRSGKSGRPTRRSRRIRAHREWMSNRSLLLLMAISGRGRPEPDGRS
jgi:hypothetical protein